MKYIHLIVICVSLLCLDVLQSVYARTTGFDNSFFGVSAGKLNVDGSQNTFMGVSSGFNNSSGSENTFAGNFAGSGAAT